MGTNQKMHRALLPPSPTAWRQSQVVAGGRTLVKVSSLCLAMVEGGDLGQLQGGWLLTCVTTQQILWVVSQLLVCSPIPSPAYNRTGIPTQGSCVTQILVNS